MKLSSAFGKYCETSSSGTLIRSTHSNAKFAAIVLMILTCGVAMGAGSIDVTGLKCEYKVCPLGIDVQRPALSWKLEERIQDQKSRSQKQTAYQILAASSETLLKDGWFSKCRADLWDSGKVVSGSSVGVVYGGKPLKSGQRVWWKVRVWDKDDMPGQYSETEWWEMALLSPADWKGKWISPNKPPKQSEEDLYSDDPAPLLRKGFKVGRAVKRVRAYITGLGYYELRINGSRIGDHMLDPGWTSYDKRVLYSTYDVTDFLREGDNAIGVILGNGWYNPLPLRMWGHLNLRKHLALGQPCCIVQLNIEYYDGSSEQVVSDNSWRTADGPILRNNIYLGELYDARKEIKSWDHGDYDDKAWQPAVIVAGPAGSLEAQSQPPIRIKERFPAVSVAEPKPGVFVYDMGRNFSGWARFKFKAPAGTKFVMRYGELLDKDGSLNPMTSVCGQIKRKDKGGPGAPEIAWQGDTYIAKGGGEETYMPRFTFHGFRYVEVTGLPQALPLDAVTGVRLNSDVPVAGSFACSNERFNRIQQMCRRTFLANLFSVQSDCPHRERMGYGGDIVASSEALMMNFDMSTFYAKTVLDWADSTRPDGRLTDTAPFMGIDYCGVGWAMAHPLLLSQLYQYYGNERLMAEQYEVARRWLLQVAENSPDGIIKGGLSDHESLTPKPAPPMVTPLYYQSARMLADMARVIKRDDDAKQFDVLAEKICQAYQKNFLDTATGKAEPGTQASQAFALYSGLVPDEVRSKALNFLLENINVERKGHLSTGIMGTKFMLDVLSRGGSAGVAFGIVNQPDFPGWGWMLENGATTLWEHWEYSDNTYSHSHPMFGSVSQWFINWLGGIQPEANAVGFDKIIIAPQVVGDLRWVKSSYASVRGTIRSGWSLDAKGLTMSVTIPVNTTATVYIPASSSSIVKEGSQLIDKAPGVQLLRREKSATVVAVGSGDYKFSVEAAAGAEQ